jgi:hypothetical protein
MPTVTRLLGDVQVGGVLGAARISMGAGGWHPVMCHLFQAACPVHVCNATANLF